MKPDKHGNPFQVGTVYLFDDRLCLRLESIGKDDKVGKFVYLDSATLKPNGGTTHLYFTSQFSVYDVGSNRKASSLLDKEW
jgi:hypothetical protein